MALHPMSMSQDSPETLLWGRLTRFVLMNEAHGIFDNFKGKMAILKASRKLKAKLAGRVFPCLCPIYWEAGIDLECQGTIACKVYPDTIPIYDS